MTTLLPGAWFPALVAVAFGLPALDLTGGDRRRRLRTLVTLLRATDPVARIDALEKSRLLPSKDRSALAKLLRQDLLSTQQGSAPPNQAITVWFIRQVLALLADARVEVRMDAARVLRVVLDTQMRSLQETAEKEDWGSLSPAVIAAVELAGGKALPEDQPGRAQARALALAEMLESGLRPLAVGIQAMEGMGEETMGTLTSALRDRNPRVRRTLAEVLAAMGGEQSIELLIPLLQDPTPELRARAAESLGRLKASAATGPITQLLEDPVAEVRAAAATALAEIGVESAAAAIVTALTEECRRDDASESARAAMISSVARLCDGSRQELVQALTDLPRPVAARLAAAMERTGHVESALTEPEYEGWSDLFVKFLARVASLGVSKPFLDMLDSADDWVRLRAAAALGYSHDPNAVTAVGALLGDPDANVRSEAASSIARMGDARALTPLAHAAADPDRAVRLAAIRGLHQVLKQRSAWRIEALPADFDMKASFAESHRALLLAATDPQEQARLEAAGALGMFNSSDTAEALIRLALGDSDDAVRRAASEGLQRCGFPQTRRLLADALDDKEETRRARAMTLLGAIGGAESGRHLLEALRDPAQQVREFALLGLSRLSVEGLKDRLVLEIQNPDPRVRAGVAMLLGKANATEYVAELARALSDPEEQVRVNALNALAGLGRPVRKHQPEINARLSDPSPRVREVAGAALETLRDSWAEAPDPAELLRQGALSVAGAAALIEMAAEGGLEPLVRALDAPRSARALASYFAGEGWKDLGLLLASLRQFSENDQSRTTSALARALRGYDSPASYLRGLKSITTGDRLTSVEIAGLLASPAACDALIEVLQSDPVSEVRSRAASMLGACPGDAPQAALQRAQTTDQSKLVRLAATRALNPDRTTAPQLDPTEKDL